MLNSVYYLPDFLEIQRQSFFTLLEKGLIDEFSKRNPITSKKKDVEVYFYPEYYKLTLPTYSPRQAILRCKSYTSKLYMPVQITFKKTNTIRLKWAYIGNLPLMTKRGHFILNGAPRIIVNQIIRSPGIYYQEKLYERFTDKLSDKPNVTYKRYYADLICLRGTWLRLEIDRDKDIWAQTKKGPKIPIYWYLIGMGLSEHIILNSILEPQRILQNLAPFTLDRKSTRKKRNDYSYVKNPPDAWKEIYLELSRSPKSVETSTSATTSKDNSLYSKGSTTKDESPRRTNKVDARNALTSKKKSLQKEASEQGRKWLFNKFMNPRAYDLSRQGRAAFNRKLGLKIDENQLTLTAQDLLSATDYLIKVEKGLKPIDDIDHLKNRRVRTSGELIQIQIGIAVVRLEKTIREKINKTEMQFSFSLGDAPRTSRISSNFKKDSSTQKLKQLRSSTGLINDQIAPITTDITNFPTKQPIEFQTKNEDSTYVEFSRPVNPENSNIKSNSEKNLISSSGMVTTTTKNNTRASTKKTKPLLFGNLQKNQTKTLNISNLINNKSFNSALREFFGTSPLSQFMDQINPLAEITHKRRLSSMGPGGVTRDTATLEIRGIHPTHYGRICPVETPEGKNTGLVNSLTNYSRVNSLGILESPFYRVYKGMVQKNLGLFYLSAEQEEKTKLGAADLFVSSIDFLENNNIPVRIGEKFTKIHRNLVEYVGVSPTQMISIATSLIPFLEHDDANRALMGSNMQRQAVPVIRPERPIVGTGLESRAVSDSGHVIQSRFSGVITYVSSDKIIVRTLKK
uniref:DNA-directed RNA polymerase n=1 Tax=Chlamydomonas moewusii TaxID=3054 RepID=B2X2B8_CHLMO|nr:RNA polymerase beta subunit [Chlamydomonas moewusii]